MQHTNNLNPIITSLGNDDFLDLPWVTSCEIDFGIFVSPCATSAHFKRNFERNKHSAYVG